MCAAPAATVQKATDYIKFKESSTRLWQGQTERAVTCDFAFCKRYETNPLSSDQLLLRTVALR